MCHCVMRYPFLTTAKARRKQSHTCDDTIRINDVGDRTSWVAEDIGDLVGGISHKTMWVNCQPAAALAGNDVVMMKVAVQRPGT